MALPKARRPLATGVAIGCRIGLGLLLASFLAALAGYPAATPVLDLAPPFAWAVLDSALCPCILLGDCFPGSLGSLGPADAACVLAVLFLAWYGVRPGIEGVRLAEGARTGNPLFRPSRPGATLALSLPAGLVVAGIAGTALEAAGLWTRLWTTPDPRAEQGAPLWVAWLIVVLSVAACAGAARRSPQLTAVGRLPLVGGWMLRAAVVAWMAAIAVHASRPEPVQGRYYGVTGVRVGRLQTYEYGTSLGMLAPALAGIWSLGLLAAAGSRRHLEGEAVL